MGVIGKWEAHQKALLHRAFSIFIFDSKGDMLLHQRAINKYHSGGLWTNACCSHPYEGQQIKNAAEKRLLEEMGFSVSLRKAFEFIYKASFENGLTEYEYDHVFVGVFDGEIFPDEKEVKDYAFVNMNDIKNSLKSHPHNYTEWFKIAFPKMENYLADVQKLK